MKTKILLSAAMLGIVSTACQMAVAPPGSKAEDNCNGSSKKCRVTVISIDPNTRKGTVDINGLTIDHGAHNVHVFWRLTQSCFFNAAAGDGVFLKKPSDDDGQFSEQFPTDDENENPAPNLKNGKKYHWKDKNTNAQVHKYDYKMTFHCDDGAPYDVDPWIQNG